MTRLDYHPKRHFLTLTPHRATVTATIHTSDWKKRKNGDAMTIVPTAACPRKPISVAAPSRSHVVSARENPRTPGPISTSPHPTHPGPEMHMAHSPEKKRTKREKKENDE